MAGRQNGRTGGVPRPPPAAADFRCLTGRESWFFVDLEGRFKPRLVYLLRLVRD